MRNQEPLFSRKAVIAYFSIVVILLLILLIQKLGKGKNADNPSDPAGSSTIAEDTSSDYPSEEPSAISPSREESSEAPTPVIEDSSEESHAESSSEESDPAADRTRLGTYYPSTDYLQPISCVQTSEKKIALTFNASWNIDTFNELLDILDTYDAHATFFLVGYWIDAFPEAMQKLADSGYDVMNHSNTHPDYPNLDFDNICRELDACNNKIEAYTGIRPILARPPSGAYNDTTINAIHYMGMEAIQWDVDSIDWMETTSASDIYQNIMTYVEPGSILLFHVEGHHTVEILPKILDELIAQGYSFTSVYDLILKEDYTIDQTGRQVPLS